MMMKLFICLGICLAILLISIRCLVKQLSKNKYYIDEPLEALVEAIASTFMIISTICILVFGIKLFMLVFK